MHSLERMKNMQIYPFTSRVSYFLSFRTLNDTIIERIISVRRIDRKDSTNWDDFSNYTVGIKPQIRPSFYKDAKIPYSLTFLGKT